MHSITCGHKKWDDPASRRWASAKKTCCTSKRPFSVFFSPKLGMLLGAPNKWIFTLWLLNIAMQKYPFIDDLSWVTFWKWGFSIVMLNKQRVTMKNMRNTDIKSKKPEGFKKKWRLNWSAPSLDQSDFNLTPLSLEHSKSWWSCCNGGFSRINGRHGRNAHVSLRLMCVTSSQRKIEDTTVPIFVSSKILIPLMVYNGLYLPSGNLT